jgi:hypothetical protein
MDYVVSSVCHQQFGHDCGGWKSHRCFGFSADPGGSGARRDGDYFDCTGWAGGTSTTVTVIEVTSVSLAVWCQCLVCEPKDARRTSRTVAPRGPACDCLGEGRGENHFLCYADGPLLYWRVRNDTHDFEQRPAAGVAWKKSSGGGSKPSRGAAFGRAAIVVEQHGVYVSGAADGAGGAGRCGEL